MSEHTCNQPLTRSFPSAGELVLERKGGKCVQRGVIDNWCSEGEEGGVMTGACDTKYVTLYLCPN